jgi:hypothetical protein
VSPPGRPPLPSPTLVLNGWRCGPGNVTPRSMTCSPREGLTARSARCWGLSPKTVRKFIRAATAEQVITGPRPPSSGIDRFAPYLHERWNQGCTDAARLHAEIQAQGYRGSNRSVRRYLQPLRATLTTPVLPPPPPTVREVTRWITSHPGHLTDEETAKLGQVKARSTHLSATAGHVTALARREATVVHGELRAVGQIHRLHLHGEGAELLGELALVELTGVTAPASDNVWAVGFASGSSTALVEHWDGTSWSVVSSPAFADVSANAARACSWTAESPSQEAVCSRARLSIASLRTWRLSSPVEGAGS